MAHAEKCPVCNGIGRTEYVEGGSGTTVRKSQPCHGCGGKGWIEVGDTIPSPTPFEINPAPMPYLPPYSPYREWPRVIWTYPFERGL